MIEGPQDSTVRQTQSKATPPVQELHRLLHQFQERQLDLELQNLELREALLPPSASPEGRTQVFNSASFHLFELDQRAVIRNVNRAGAEWLGGSRAEYIGKNFSEFIDPSDLEKFQRRWKQCYEGQERLSLAVRVQPSRAEPVEAQLFCRPVPGAGVFRVIVAEMTPVKNAEKKIQRLISFPAFNPNPILELAENGSILWGNDAAQQLPHFLGCKNLRETLPAETPEIVRECLASKRSHLRHEMIFGERHLFWSFFPICSSGVVHCYGTDITERLAIEAQLHRSQKMESIGQLASAVAHDFNNILMIIQGHTSLLMAQNELPFEITESLKQISTASERATHLTRQLMTFSRKQNIQPRLVNLGEIVHSMEYLLRGVIGEKVSRQFVLAPNLPPVQADTGMIEQMVMDLAVNAHDAMPDGGKLTISTSVVEVDEEHARQNPEARVGQFVCLTVSDTGVGIGADLLGKIFDPFFTTKESGTGLGLSTAYGIAKQHQGWIEVSSRIGAGTSFKVFLPVAGTMIEEKKTIEPRELRGSETIFVIEDEPALRELVVRQLKKEGYKIIQASSGSEALEIWPRHVDEVDLLFTDMILSDGMTGRDLAETLLAQKPDLKIIYTSGYSQDVVEQDFALRKDAKFLQKPYKNAKMLKIVRAALDEEKLDRSVQASSK